MIEISSLVFADGFATLDPSAAKLYFWIAMTASREHPWTWSFDITLDELSEQTGLPRDRVVSCLNILIGRELIGFDLLHHSQPSSVPFTIRVNER